MSSVKDHDRADCSGYTCDKTYVRVMVNDGALIADNRSSPLVRQKARGSVGQVFDAECVLAVKKAKFQRVPGSVRPF